MPLVRLFQDKLVRMPADAGVREGLHKVRKIVTAAGNVRFDAPTTRTGTRTSSGPWPWRTTRPTT
jgi:hypothetical protein